MPMDKNYKPNSYNPKLEQIVAENLKAWPSTPMDRRTKHMETPLSTESYMSVEDSIRKSMKKKGKRP